MHSDGVDFRLLVLTPEAGILQELVWVNRLFENGLSCLHVRKPYWQQDKVEDYLKGIDREYHSRIMLHHQPRLLEHFPLQGLHLKQDALPDTKPTHKLSCPVHSWQEFVAVQQRVDYALISPFFNSLSKKGYGANKELWNMPAEAKGQKAIALGGIDANNVLKVRQLGLGGAALLGSIWHTADDPLKAFLRIDKLIKNAR